MWAKEKDTPAPPPHTWREPVGTRTPRFLLENQVYLPSPSSSTFFSRHFFMGPELSRDEVLTSGIPSGRAGSSRVLPAWRAVEGCAGLQMKAGRLIAGSV